MKALKTQVLEILSADCRIPLERIAVMTGAAVDEVAQAIDEMEQERVILQYAPVINWDRTERERVEAMIEVKIMPQQHRGFDAIASTIARFDEVKSVYLMSGGYDLLVLAEARTLKELALFVTEKLGTLDAVSGASTSFVLKRYKKDGVIFAGDNADKRLAVTL